MTLFNNNHHDKFFDQNISKIKMKKLKKQIQNKYVKGLFEFLKILLQN